jgi:NAD(P)-dependent dehydrogenase (short-subunit alcohol dehydrogenase family)
MSKVLITGSNDGLGLEAARRLVGDGHEVVGHARSRAKADGLRAALPGLAEVLVADLAAESQVRRLAQDADALGAFDAVIHNAGVGFREPERIATEEGHAHVLAINVLAPYVLTATMRTPGRLVYLTSGLHAQGDADVADLDWTERRWNGYQAYCDSKLLDATLAAAVARRRPDVVATSVSPGWVATKMGGAGAPDDFAAGSVTQAWLAVSDDDGAGRSGALYYHQEAIEPHPAVEDPGFQDAALAALAQLTGVELAARSS